MEIRDPESTDGGDPVRGCSHLHAIQSGERTRLESADLCLLINQGCTTARIRGPPRNDL
jgi:hypothetical protein